MMVVTLRGMPRLPLPSGADVVIVGGGVVGVSAAFHLAEAGAEVVLLERDQLASGSTSKAAGGLRAQFSDALNIEIAKRSLDAYKQFEQRPGWEIDYEEIGYLFLLTTESELDAFRRSVALQNELGVPSRIITPDEAREICPLIAGEDILAASYCPTDAHATPESVVQGYAYGARQHGAHIAVSTPVDAIDVADGAIKAVRTTHGSTRAPIAPHPPSGAPPSAATPPTRHAPTPRQTRRSTARSARWSRASAATGSTSRTCSTANRRSVTTEWTAPRASDSSAARRGWAPRSIR